MTIFDLWTIAVEDPVYSVSLPQVKCIYFGMMTVPIYIQTPQHRNYILFEWLEICCVRNKRTTYVVVWLMCVRQRCNACLCVDDYSVVIHGVLWLVKLKANGMNTADASTHQCFKLNSPKLTLRSHTHTHVHIRRQICLRFLSITHKVGSADGLIDVKCIYEHRNYRTDGIDNLAHIINYLFNF